jgi:hypothetical protein
MDRDKRDLREQKRILKRKGNQHNRREVRRRLAEHPEEAADIAVDFGRFGTAGLNGNDHDATRRRDQRPAVEGDGDGDGDDPGPIP